MPKIHRLFAVAAPLFAAALATGTAYAQTSSEQLAADAQAQFAVYYQQPLKTILVSGGRFGGGNPGGWGNSPRGGNPGGGFHPLPSYPHDPGGPHDGPHFPDPNNPRHEPPHDGPNFPGPNNPRHEPPHDGPNFPGPNNPRPEEPHGGPHGPRGPQPNRNPDHWGGRFGHDHWRWDERGVPHWWWNSWNNIGICADFYNNEFYDCNENCIAEGSDCRQSCDWDDEECLDDCDAYTDDCRDTCQSDYNLYVCPVLIP